MTRRKRCLKLGLLKILFALVAASGCVESFAAEDGHGQKHPQKAQADDAKLTPEQVRELYLRRKRTLEQLKGRQEELSRDNKTLGEDRARLQARLVQTGQALKTSEQRLNDIEERLSVARQRALDQRLKLEEKTNKMSSLFAVMEVMGRQPPPMMIAHSQDALNMIRTGMVLRNFYVDLEKIASSISVELAEVEAVQAQAEEQERLYRDELGRNKALKTQLDTMLSENQEELEVVQQNLEGLKNVSKVHASNIKSLEEMIQKLDSEVAKKSSLSAYESELAKGGSAELSPDKARLALQSVRMKPAIPFAKSQGLLPYPAQGKMVLLFGDQDIDGAPSKGAHFETRAGAQVVSPCDGWIIYAGPFRSYGQLLIINAGGGYHVVIAGMDRVQASIGQFVLAGEPIATMGPLQLRGADNRPARPTLYVEFRRDKQSIDPAPWWSAGVGKG